MNNCGSSSNLHFFWIACFLVIVSINFFILSCMNIASPSVCSISDFDGDKELVHFSSLYELKLWLALDHTDEVEYVSDSYDCDDYAFNLQKNARNAGYLLDITLVDSCDIVAYSKGYTKWHVTILAIIPLENEIYIVDPQTDGVTKMANID